MWSLPDWVGELRATPGCVYADHEARMALAVELAARNVAAGTGGPFGAAVFERDTGALVGLGVNRVVSERCSHAHAEMVALAAAQQRVGTFDLAAKGLPVHELVTSCEPCAMCLGAIPWSGVSGLVCGATDADARTLGFDEGEKPADWRGGLERRGVAVRTDVGRDAARAVLESFRAAGGRVYTSRRTDGA